MARPRDDATIRAANDPSAAISFHNHGEGPLLVGAFTVIMKTDCENRWIVCSTIINARLLSACSVINGNALLSEAYFLSSYHLFII